MNTADQAAISGKNKKSPGTYEVGTLRYNTRTLVILFVWLIGGDFAFCFFEGIFANFIPLYLKQYDAPNVLIGVMTGSLAGVVNILFLPAISQWSDECRSSWGRRIPLLVFAAPLTVISMILLGFAPEIAGLLQGRVIRPISPGVSLNTVILCTISVFVLAFHFLNMMLVNAFNWLLRDVVPQEWMTRFLSWFRIVTTVAGVLFSWYVFPHILTERREICVGIGLLYLVIFLLMCWKVKEGAYAPVPPRERKPGVVVAYVRYFKTCLSVPIYRYYFISVMINGLGICSLPFFLLFQRETLGVSMDYLGKIFAVQGILTAVLCVPMGWICDRFSPFRISLALQPVLLLLTLASFFFINGRNLMVFAVIGPFFSVPAGLASAAMTMELFPGSKFGQFFAAQNLFSMGVRIAGNYFIGLFLDMTHSNYRMVYIWNALCAVPMFLASVLVYREWMRNGGAENYVAPIPPEYDQPRSNPVAEAEAVKS